MLQKSLARLETVADRVFPSLTSNPYDARDEGENFSGDLQTARTILAMVRQPLSRAQRLGKRLDPLSAVVRLLYLHRQAVQEECIYRTDRADFWWLEVATHLRSLSADHPGWAALAQQLGNNMGITILADPQQLRTRLIRELFLDTHLGFYNGMISDGDIERAGFHLERVRALVPEAGMSVDEARELLTQTEQQHIETLQAQNDWSGAIRTAQILRERYPDHQKYGEQLLQLYSQAIKHHKEKGAWPEALRYAEELAKWQPHKPDYQGQIATLYQQGITAYKAKHDWGQAIRFAERLVQRQPGCSEYLEQFVALHLQATTEGMPSSDKLSEAGARREADRIHTHIGALEGLLDQEPGCHPAYEALGILYHLLAVNLANGHRPSQALLAVEKALTYKPHWNEAQDSRVAIEAFLTNLWQQTNTLRQQLREAESQPTLSESNRASVRRQLLSHVLNDEGMKLFEETESGTRSRDQFRNSRDQKRIQQAREQARSRWLWLRTGLPKPSISWDERAQALERAIDLLLAKEPHNTEDLLQKWITLIDEYPDLDIKDINPQVILGLFTESKGEEEASDREMEDNVPSETEYQGTRDSTPDRPSMETAGTLEMPERHVPLLKVMGPRLKSRGDYVPLEFWLFSWRGLGTKAVLFAGVVLLGVAGVLAAIDGRARYERDQAYAQLKEAAAQLDDPVARTAVERFRVARPLATEDERLHVVNKLSKVVDTWPNQRTRNDAYARFLIAVQHADYLAILLATETYLDALAPNDKDPRTPQIWDWYKRVFTDWLLEQESEHDTIAQARIDKYRQLTLANTK